MIDRFIEVSLKKQDDFLKIKETLTRIGVSSNKTNTIYQSCHILHKKGKYYIVHFKELFALDGKQTNLSTEDISRRNTIAALLQEWGLLTIVNPSIITSKMPINQIKIIPFSDKKNWKLESKYNIGRKIWKQKPPRQKKLEKKLIHSF